MSRALAAALVALFSLVSGCADDDAHLFGPKPDSGLVADQPQLSITVGAGGTVTIDPMVAGGDSANLSYSLGTPEHGTVTGATPPFMYTPEEGFTGTDMFDITVSNNNQSVTVTVTVNVVAELVATDSNVTVQQDSTVEFTLGVSGANDQPLTYTIVWGPQHGTLSGDAPLLVYTPERFFSGTDSVKFTVSDGDMTSNEATVTIEVEHVVTCGDGITETGEACDDGNDDDSDDCRNDCALPTCGDGIVQAGEQCDDKNTVDTDACRNNCMRAKCGDGVVQAGKEACDDGNRKQTDACTNACTVARCGDGIVQAGVEACDDGNRVDTDACLNSCKTASCGDGIVHAGTETCDDANTVDTDDCPNTCKVASCGDGVVQAGVEQCDDGNDSNTDACLSSCIPATCGDGFTQAGVEQCDDANQLNTDACLNTCVTATCGDTFVQVGVEQCDDGNTVDTDACPGTCKSATCGDGQVQAGVEQCDDGNDSNADDCLNSCVNAGCGDGFTKTGVEECDDADSDETDDCLSTCKDATCGDGFVQAGVEQCDDADSDDTDSCLSTCKIATCGDGELQTGVEACDDANYDNTDECLNICALASCGDGFTQAGVEECDDGNASETDACLSTCKDATCGDGFTQTGVEACDDGNTTQQDACLNTCVEAACGDGFTQTGVEACDDGNSTNGDGCSASCALPVCGDGALDTGEECDDGNLDNDDGCGQTCLVERCGDDLVQFTRGEQCDDGNTAAGDGCDASCQSEPFVTTAPVKISAALSCTTSVANAARKIAVDGSGTVYALMTCGSSAYVAISTDRGLTFSAPLDLSVDLPDASVVVSQLAVVAPRSRLAHVAIMLTNGQVYLRTTRDAGATWQAAVSVGQTNNTSSGLSLEAFNNDLYVGFAVGGGVAVTRNRTAGVAPFDVTNVGMSIAFFDVVYDVVGGTLAVVADTPGFHVRVSTDRGATFGAEVNPAGQEYYSDWAIGKGQIFVSGTNLGALGDSARLYIIPTSAPNTSTFVAGLPSVSTAQTRTVAADAAGNAYAMSQLNGGGVQLDRLAAGTTAFSTPRTLSATGTSPIAAPLPGGQGAAVIYTEGTSVWATIQAY